MSKRTHPSETKGPRRRLRRANATVLVLVLAGLITGCASGRTVSLTPEESDIPACETPAEIAVEDLGLTDCDLAGVAIRFPDGVTQILKPGSAGSSWEATAGPQGAPVSRYELANFGIYGLAAGYQVDDGPHQRWGSAKAIEFIEYLDDETP